MAAPAYGDFYNYLNPGSVGGSESSNSPYTISGGGGSYTTQQGGGEGGSTDVQVQDTPWQFTTNDANIPDKYKGVVTGASQGTGGGTNQYQFDLSKLPNGGMTKFMDHGKPVSLTDMMTLGSDPSGPDLSQYQGKEGTSTLLNPKQMYYDPNYGWITPKSNIRAVDPKEQGFMKYVNKYMPYVGSLAMMAMGDPMGVAMFNGMTGLMKGQNPASILLGLAGSATGLPGGGMAGSMVGSLFNIGKSGKSGGGNKSGGNTGSQQVNMQQLLPILLLLSMANKGGGKTGG